MIRLILSSINHSQQASKMQGQQAQHLFCVGKIWWKEWQAGGDVTEGELLVISGHSWQMWTSTVAILVLMTTQIHPFIGLFLCGALSLSQITHTLPVKPSGVIWGLASCSRTLRHEIGETGIDLPILWLVDNRLYLLSHTVYAII